METKALSKDNHKPLSASKIKTFESCSWLFYCNYVLHLPQTQNDGARKGGILHSIFELLLNKKHYKKFKKIIKNGTGYCIPAIKRLILIYAKKAELEITPEVLQQMDEMLMVGLKSDFFVEGATLIAPEYRFDLLNASPRYYIRGFMDKPFMKDKEIIIDDFKSSKKKFEGEDQESNVQAMIYSLAALKLWPDKEPTVRFIFLQFPKDPMMKLTFSRETLKGFEEYLAHLQSRIDNFTEKDAQKDFACDQSPPKNGEFKGRLMCGFAKSPSALKKDGTKMWACPYKWPINYWVVTKNGEILSSAFESDKLSPKDGEKLEKRHYEGCPKFNKTSYLNTSVGIGIPKLGKSFNVIDSLF